MLVTRPQQDSDSTEPAAATAASSQEGAAGADTAAAAGGGGGAAGGGDGTAAGSTAGGDGAAAAAAEGSGGGGGGGVPLVELKSFTTQIFFTAWRGLHLGLLQVRRNVPLVTQDTTPPGPFLEARLLRTKPGSKKQARRFRKAVGEIFPTPPCWGPTFLFGAE